MEVKPSPAWIGFFSEARRLSMLANERALAVLPVFQFGQSGLHTITTKDGKRVEYTLNFDQLN